MSLIIFLILAFITGFITSLVFIILKKRKVSFLGTFQIGEKDWEFQMTYGKHLKLIRKYKDAFNAINWDTARYNSYIFDAIWLAIKRDFIFKPFITKKNMSYSMTLKELRWFQLNIGKIITGDDEYISLEEFDEKIEDKVEKN